jgi:hypothetical protein
LPWGNPHEKPAPKEKVKDKSEPKAMPLRLPPEDELKPWTADDRTRFATRLEQLGRRLGSPIKPAKSEAALVEAITFLDLCIDQKRGQARPARDPGKLNELGSAQRRLRAILWKNGVKEYDEMRLNSTELLDQLEQQLVKEGVIKEVENE